eukprot:UN02064
MKLSNIMKCNTVLLILIFKAHSGWMTIRRYKFKQWLLMTIEDHGGRSVVGEEVDYFYKSICLFLDDEDPKQQRTWLDIALDSGKGYANLLRIDVAFNPNDPNGLVVAFTKVAMNFAMPPNITIIRHGYKNALQNKMWDELVFTPHHITHEEVDRALSLFQNIGIAQAPPEFYNAIGMNVPLAIDYNRK